MNKCFDMSLRENPQPAYEISGFRCADCDGVTITSIEEYGEDTSCPFDGMEPCAVCSWDHATMECSEGCDTYFCKEHMPKDKVCSACKDKELGEPE